MGPKLHLDVSDVSDVSDNAITETPCMGKSWGIRCGLNGDNRGRTVSTDGVETEFCWLIHCFHKLGGEQTNIWP